MTFLEAALLALAAWRWARLVTVDEIARPARDLLRRKANRDPNRWEWAAYWSGCPHCVGVWTSASVVAVWAWAPAWGPAWGVLVVAPAVAGAVSLIALLVPPE